MTDPEFHAIDKLAYATGRPPFSATIRTCNEDFEVRENLSFEPLGDGDHLYLLLEKNGWNTEDVAVALAKATGVPKKEVGYAGLKDKNALTVQWFSVKMKQEPDWAIVEKPGLRVLQVARHRKKLKTGSISKNDFRIVLRDVTDEGELERRLASIEKNGVPNYFGEQRFGYNGANLLKAQQMLMGRKVKNRHLRGVYFSALRSYMFNQVLSHRVERGIWNCGLAGDAMVLAGSRSFFVAPVIDEQIQERIDTFDIHPSGPLPGDGNNVEGEALLLEQQVLAPYSELCEALVRHQLRAQRRALRLCVQDLSIQNLGSKAVDSKAMGSNTMGCKAIALSFSLPSGAYATSVLRELCDYSVAQAPSDRFRSNT